MGLIENPKTYTGRDLETIFFRPMLTGDNAEQIGIRVLYNMPVPTTIQMWSPAGDILKPYSSGWTGGDSATRKQKTITMQKIKAETGYSASDYFSQVYELITGRPDVNMDDLSGTELEKAETEMFRAAIAESLRATMWVGDMADTASPLNKFDGFMALIRNYNAFMDFPMVDFTERQLTSETVVDLLDEMWRTAPPILKSMKGEGNLAYFVTTDVIDCYERYLDRIQLVLAAVQHGAVVGQLLLLLLDLRGTLRSELGDAADVGGDARHRPRRRTKRDMSYSCSAGSCATPRAPFRHRARGCVAALRPTP